MQENANKINVPFHFKPREYQIPIFQAVDNPDIRFIIQVWARRNGKDKTDLNAVISAMAREPMNVFYVFPELAQARKALWDAVDNDGFRLIDHFPKELIKGSPNKSNLTIEFLNGSIFTLVGTKDDAEALRGTNGKIYVFSEFADAHPDAFDIVLPIVLRNNGKIIVNGTPKLDGRNGAAFKKKFDEYKNYKYAFVSERNALGVATEDELEIAKKTSMERWGNDFFFRQEYLLDWGQVSSGTYYGDKISMITKRGQVGAFPYNPDYPVYTAWDLGIRDDTAIWFFQKIKDKIHMIDFYSGNDVGISSYAKFVLSQPYQYGEHFFPHDSVRRDNFDAESTIQQLREKMGMVNSTVLRRLSVESGISNTVEALSNICFNISSPRVMQAVETLKLYKRKFNEHTNEYLGPDHDSTSHAADALRYSVQASKLVEASAMVIQKDATTAYERLHELELAALNHFPKTDEVKPTVFQERLFSRPPQSNLF